MCRLWLLNSVQRRAHTEYDTTTTPLLEGRDSLWCAVKCADADYRASRVVLGLFASVRLAESGGSHREQRAQRFYVAWVSADWQRQNGAEGWTQLLLADPDGLEMESTSQWSCCTKAAINA